MSNLSLRLPHTALLAGCALAACTWSSGALAGPKASGQHSVGSLPRYGMVVFSDLCINGENGEFGGQRITLQRFAEVDTVIYEYTAGGLSWPLVAGEVTIDPRGRQMIFTVQPPDEDERTVNAKLSDDGTALVLEGGYCGDQAVPMRLPKVTDFGARAGACRKCPAPKKKPAEGKGAREDARDGDIPA